jgi:hypothetical protein
LSESLPRALRPGSSLELRRWIWDGVTVLGSLIVLAGLSWLFWLVWRNPPKNWHFKDGALPTLLQVAAKRRRFGRYSLATAGRHGG